MVESKAAKELAIKLRKLWDNDDYVKGVITFAKTEKLDNLSQEEISNL